MSTLCYILIPIHFVLFQQISKVKMDATLQSGILISHNAPVSDVQVRSMKPDVLLLCLWCWGGVFKPGLKWYVVTGSIPWDATWLSSAFLFACSSHWLFQDDTLLVRGLVVICRCPGSPALEWGESTVSLTGKLNFTHLTLQIESKILVSSFAFNSFCTLLIACH